MRRILLIGVLAPAALAAAGILGWNLHRMFGEEPALAAASAKTAQEERILAAIRHMETSGDIRFGVPESDGRRLRLLVEAAGARNVVEVGTSTGYSGLWLCLGVSATGGHVTTFELEPRIAARARENFRRAGADGLITVVEGDAHRMLAAAPDPIDVVFLDADKEGYLDYLKQLLPRVRPGGLVLAHNVERAPGYVARVASDKALDTVALTQGSGLSATLKKR